MAARTGASVDLCGRDALALRAGRANASLNAHRSAVQGSAGRGSADQAGGAQDGEAMSQALCVAWADGLPASSYDLLAEFPDITPRVDTMEELWANARRVLKLGGSYVCSLSSSDYDRFERRKPKGFTKLREKKKKGWTAGLWRLDAL